MPKASRCRASCSRPWRSRTAANAATCARPTRRRIATARSSDAQPVRPRRQGYEPHAEAVCWKLHAAAAPAVASNIAAAPAVQRGSQQPGIRAMRRSRRSFRGAAPSQRRARRRTRATSCSTSRQPASTYVPGDSFGLYPWNDPALAEAMLRGPARAARFPRDRRQKPFRDRADRGLRAGRRRPTCCSS